MGERNRRIIEKNPGEQQPSRVLIVPFGCTNLTVPTGNLDVKSGQNVLGLLKMSVETYRQTLIMITHNLEIAQMADRVLRMEDGRLKA